MHSTLTLTAVAAAAMLVGAAGADHLRHTPPAPDHPR